MNNRRVTIRAATRADAERLFEIRHRSILNLAVPILSVEQAQTWAAGRDMPWMKSVISANSIWVAQIEDVIAGWVGIAEDRVIGLYVDPDFSCGGVGSQLLARVEVHLSSQGVPVVRLEASWNSERFYLRRGYQPGWRSPRRGTTTNV